MEAPIASSASPSSLPGPKEDALPCALSSSKAGKGVPPPCPKQATAGPAAEATPHSQEAGSIAASRSPARQAMTRSTAASTMGRKRGPPIMQARSSSLKLPGPAPDTEPLSSTGCNPPGCNPPPLPASPSHSLGPVSHLVTRKSACLNAEFGTTLRGSCLRLGSALESACPLPGPSCSLERSLLGGLRLCTARPGCTSAVLRGLRLCTAGPGCTSAVLKGVRLCTAGPGCPSTVLCGLRLCTAGPGCTSAALGVAGRVRSRLSGLAAAQACGSAGWGDSWAPMPQQATRRQPRLYTSRHTWRDPGDRIRLLSL